MLVKVRTDYDETPWIKAGKVYELERQPSKYGDETNPLYKGIGELGSPFYTRLINSQHIGCKDWEIIK